MVIAAVFRPFIPRLPSLCGALLCCLAPVPALATDAPRDLRALAADGEVILTWTAPDMPTMGYRVKLGRQNGSSNDTNFDSCTASPCTIAGLTNGEQYRFRIASRNVQGDYSSYSRYVYATPDGRSFVLPGGIGLSYSSSDAGCTLEHAALEAPAASGPKAPPPGLVLPHGLVDFALTGCSQVQIVLTYPAIPAGVRYWKRNAANAWAPFAGAVVDAAAGTVTLTLTDNGPGDDDPAPGRIADPGGVGVMAAPAGSQAIPTLGEWGVLLLSALAGLLGWRQVKAKSARNA